MSVVNILAAVAVKNFEGSVSWYEQLLDRPPDSRPMDGLAEWSFSKGGWMQVYADSARAGYCSVTMVEDALDDRVKSLEEKGIEVGPMTRTDFVKTAIVRDPDGNQLVFAEAQAAKNMAAAV
jgi:hypothetical protein